MKKRFFNSKSAFKSERLSKKRFCFIRIEIKIKNFEMLQVEEIIRGYELVKRNYQNNQLNNQTEAPNAPISQQQQQEIPSTPSGEYLGEQLTPLIQLGMTAELYSLSHKLIRLYPDDELSWFCIGCYYWTINKLDLAQKFVRRALKKNRSFAMGWILLGHIFAANEETEQALSSFRTAIRLLPNHKLPLLCLSKELIHSGNYWLAGHMLQSARQIDPSDILIQNEMALIAVRLGSLQQAEVILRQAIATIDPSRGNSAAFTDILYNYATLLRKLGHLPQALLWYEKCLRLSPQKVWSLVSLGFTLHLMRRSATLPLPYSFSHPCPLLL